MNGLSLNLIDPRRAETKAGSDLNKRILTPVAPIAHANNLPLAVTKALKYMIEATPVHLVTSIFAIDLSNDARRTLGALMRTAGSEIPPNMQAYLTIIVSAR